MAAFPPSRHSNSSTPIRDSNNAPTTRDSFYPATSEEDDNNDEEDLEEVGYRDDDLDSAYGGDSFIGDDTKTLSCYITDYRFEYGRRYHSYRDGAYWVCWVEYKQKREGVDRTGSQRRNRKRTARRRTSHVLPDP